MLNIFNYFAGSEHLKTCCHVTITGTRDLRWRPWNINIEYMWYLPSGAYFTPHLCDEFLHVDFLSGHCKPDMGLEESMLLSSHRLIP